MGTVDSNSTPDPTPARPETVTSAMRGTRPSICFVSIHNYPALDSSCKIEHIGGAETEKANLARALVLRGWKVSFVTLDHGQPDGVNIDGLRVFKAYRRDAGLPGVRFFFPRWSGLIAAMKRANADIYIQVNAGCETGQVAMWCRRHKKRFVFAVEADTNCTHADWRDKPWRERILYHHGLRSADHIVAQTFQQKQLLLDEFNRDSTVIRCCAKDTGQLRRTAPPNGEPKRLVWLGRFTKQKGLDYLLDFAEMCPQWHIDMVGSANVDTDYARRIRTRAESIANIRLCGQVPHAQIDKCYEPASALICTSEWEGYPTVFMEAWSRGLPVISRWDADGVIEKGGLGVVERDTARLAKAAERLLGDVREWEACSLRCRAFFEQHHTPESSALAYEKLLAQMVGEQWGRSEMSDGTRSGKSHGQ